MHLSGMPDPRPSVTRIHELDGLRGAMALFVVLYHMAGPLVLLKAAFAQWIPVLSEGWYAVDVFFVMSGFVMMHVYAAAFLSDQSWGRFWQFMRARVARLYPVHLFALFVMLMCLLPVLYDTAALRSLHGRYSIGAFLGSLLMLHSPWIDYRSWNYPAWSISAEWHAYLLFPLLAPLICKLSPVRALTVVLIGVAIPFGLYLANLWPDQYPTNGLPVLARVFPLFIAGMALYVLRPKVPRLSIGWALLAVFGTLAFLSSPGTAPLAVLFTPLLVLSGLTNNWLQSLLRRPLLLWLGKISYSLYMTHALIEAFFVRMTVRHAARFLHIDPGGSLAISLVCWCIGICLALCLGWLTWRWIEVPARDWLMMRMRRDGSHDVLLAIKR